jgi:MSHA biogenesis protein MshO
MSRGTRTIRIRQSSISGYSLAELVLVIMICGLLAGLITSFLSRPMEGYRDLRLRASLVDLAEGSLRRMARDIRAALPNSPRVSAGQRALELIHSADGARYRDAPGVNPTGDDHTAASDWLDLAGDTQFNVLGRFANLTFSYGTPLPAGRRLAVYPTSTAVYVDAATSANPGRITPAATTITLADDGDEDQISLSNPFDFLFASPRQRLYVVDTPVSFICDLGAGTLTRYSEYSIVGAQPTNPLVAPLNLANAALMADHVSACQFDYDPGTPTRSGLVTLDLTLTQGGEQIRLLHQVHVGNVP